MVTILISLNIIIISILIFRGDFKRIFKFEGMKKFYFWGMAFVFSGDILNVIRVEDLNVEYLFDKTVYYLMIWLVVTLMYSLNVRQNEELFDYSLYITLFLIFIQFISSLSSDVWVWGGETLISQLQVWPIWSQFIHCLWIFGVTTFGIFIMKLLDSVDENNRFVRILFGVLGYLVIFLGTIRYGFFPLSWMYIYTSVFLGMSALYLREWMSVAVKKRKSLVNILGVKVDNVNESDTLDRIDEMIKGKKFNLIVTPYSEFFVKAKKRESYKTAVNWAALSIPDGIFVNWAALYKGFPTSKAFPIRIFDAIWQYIFTGAAIVYYPEILKTVVKDRVSGSEFIYPLCEHAAKKGYTVMIYGGWDFGNGNVGARSAKILKKMYPKLKIVEVFPGDREPYPANKRDEEDQEATRLINKHEPDIVLSCIGNRGPESIYERREDLKAKVLIDLGGTFDYVAKDAKKVGKPVVSRGLEWILRPFMMGGTGGFKSMIVRLKRVWRGMIVGSFMMLAWKIKFGYSEEDE